MVGEGPLVTTVLESRLHAKSLPSSAPTKADVFTTAGTVYSPQRRNLARLLIVLTELSNG